MAAYNNNEDVPKADYCRDILGQFKINVTFAGYYEKSLSS